MPLGFARSPTKSWCQLYSRHTFVSLYLSICHCLCRASYLCHLFVCMNDYILVCICICASSIWTTFTFCPSPWVFLRLVQVAGDWINHKSNSTTELAREVFLVCLLRISEMMQEVRSLEVFQQFAGSYHLYWSEVGWSCLHIVHLILSPLADNNMFWPTWPTS